MLEEALTEQIIGACIEVHRELGPGLLESSYEASLCRELHLRGVPFQRQVELPVLYKGFQIDCAYRMDVVVDGRVLLEIKAIDQLDPIHEAQLLTYMKLSRLRVGLLINFDVKRMIDGIVRRVL